MDQPGGVDRVQRLGQPRAGHVQRRLRQRAVRGDRFGQRGARDVGGDQPGRVAVRIGVDHLRGVEPADPPYGREFVAEALPELRVAGQVPVHALHGHQPPAGGAAEEHHAHAAAAEPPEQPVAAHLARIGVRQWLHGQPPSRDADPTGSAA